ncbi:hypothetical protein [Sedimenticola hydrogenitrophicus]|uniref:hypothetical protein n=1 Tax=Sedimenticola hydrogenitrophicus TaxID=2967975 RepID=UPI0023AF1131|nr:hypothetical protein [Sedimenticola hydrogenitrophicus]
MVAKLMYETVMEARQMPERSETEDLAIQKNLERLNNEVAQLLKDVSEINHRLKKLEELKTKKLQ